MHRREPWEHNAIMQEAMRLVRSLMLVVLMVALPVTGVAAQVDPPRAEDEERAGPLRLLEREAPEREAEVLEWTVTPEGAVNTVIEVPASADAYIASAWPNQNFGDDALYLGYDLTGENNFGAERMVLRFDVLAHVPQGALINNARLKLRLNYSSPADDAPMGTVLRRLCSNWSEGDVTWNREPVWHEIRTEADVGSALTWYQWEITDLVRDWVARTHPNHGVEIIGDEAVQERERAFYSRETTGELYPRLVVDYTLTGDDEPPIVSVNALPEFVDRDFAVSWSGKDPGGSGIASYDVQYRVDGGTWANWIVDTTANAADFAAGQDGKFYEFRARGEDRAGNVEYFGAPEASTTVDAEPPSTSVDDLPSFTTEAAIEVSWSGQDDGSGIQYYDVRYRFADGGWVTWQRKTLATHATFHALRQGRYAFEARAVDHLGLAEDFEGEAEASIVVDTEPPTTVVDSLPVKTDETSFMVSWTGEDLVSDIRYYDVRYRYNGGSWVTWRPQTLVTSDLFSAYQGDGVYDFEARAVDELGLQEVFRGQPEASIIVDAEAPFVVPRAWLPMVFQSD